MRYRFLLIAALAPFAAQAQDATVIPVVFVAPPSDYDTQKLIDAMREAVGRVPGFNMMAKVVPDALVITFPGGIAQEGHKDEATYNFTARFFRNGDKIGESLETCTGAKLTDCTDQLAADAQSAAGMMK